MSSIHYKFRATLEYKTLAFDGLSILAADLKREICNKENIKAEAFDLILQNAHTKRQYASEEQIPRNSSIIVQRVPKEDGEKLPKIQGVNTGMVQRSDASLDSGMNVTGHIMQSEFDKLTEEERLSHIKNVSTHKYDSSNYQKRPTGALTGPPPPTYTCNRCHQPGHWFKNCPLLNQKRTTGIPSQELMETTPDDPQAMLHPSGKYVIPIMHWRARQHKKNVEETPIMEKVPSKELICPLCHHLFKDAVVTTCCGTSFCADCISQRLLESEDRHCPGDSCNKTQVSVDSLVPNKMLRQMVSKWEAGSPSESHERVRIGLVPSSGIQHNVIGNSAGLSPAHVQSNQPNVPVTTSAPQTVAPSMSVPPPSMHLPANFTQPPPTMTNMNMMMAADPLAPPGTSPMISMPPGTLHAVQSTLPPIPGVGMIDTMYNRPLSVNNGSQFMDAWEAFLTRNDKSSKTRDREYRRRKRSRERRRSRSTSEDRKRSRRTRDDRRDRDRSKDRSKRRDYEAKDSKKASYKRSNADETPEQESKRRKDKREQASPENDVVKEKMDEPLDEEAAIDDTLKEVEQLKMLSKSDEGNEIDEVESTSVKASKKADTAVESSEKEVDSSNASPEIRKSSEPESVQSASRKLESSPRNRSSDSESTVGKSDDQEKTDRDKSDHDEQSKYKSDTGKEKSRKEKKTKKHKKDKKHKRDKSETEEERKERKRIKKEKKEKKRREKEEKEKFKEKEFQDKDKKKERRHSESEDGRDHKRKDDRHREKDYKDSRRKEDHRREKDRHNDDKERSYKHKDRDRKDDRKKDEAKREDPPKAKEENSNDRKDKDKRPSKLDRLVDAKIDLSSKAAVIDEKQIREHFSPPPSMLQTRKITLNI